MKSALRLLIPTLLVVAACGGDDDGNMGDDGPNFTCAMSTLSISAFPGTATGSLKGAGADITAAEMSCAEEPFYTNPDGEDSVIELSGLTADKNYVVRLTGATKDDLAFYVTNACPMGGNVTGCALYNDTVVAGAKEVGSFKATSASAFIVVDYATEYNEDPAMFDGNFTVDVEEAECLASTECSGATPICSDYKCVAGPMFCVNDDANDGGNGDDSVSNSTMIATPTSAAATEVQGRICSKDANEADWYKVTLTEDVGISLTMDPSVDLDLYLYDANGEEVASAESSNTTETVITDGDITGSGTYYIAVVPYAPDEADQTTTTTAYTLRVNIPTCAPTEFISTTCTTAAKPICSGAGECIAGSALCVNDDAGDAAGGDDSPSSARTLSAVATSSSICSSPTSETDWYKFTAVAGTGEVINLNWTGATDLDLYVYDDKGKLYGESFYAKPEVVTLSQLPGGTYYVKVVNFTRPANTAVQAYTITGTPTVAAGCTTATSCASEYKTQLFRGTCTTATGVCSFLPDGMGAAGGLCDTSASCGQDLECSYLTFQSNAQNSKCVSADGCTSDADCSGGFKCTLDFILDLGFATVDLNKCVAPCANNTDCGVNAGDDTLDTNQPWNYNTCNTTTMVCSQDDGA